MPDEVRLWRVGSDQSLNEIARSQLDLEARLQEWLVKDISILDPNLLVIGREVPTDFGGFIDLLCIDSAGNLVVVELKRDKTPREITAQALDYGSWVVDLSDERIASIAEKHLGSVSLEDAFRSRFDSDLPETLNGDHQLLIVGSRIDASSERIIKYLVDTHGVNINAATFQYFPESEGHELLARVFLIEPSEVRTRSPRRRRNLTYEELLSLAKDAGVEDLYRHAVSSFERSLQQHTTRSSIGFAGLFGGSRKNVISLLPGDSSAAEGLRFQLYKNRFGPLTGLSPEEVEKIMPARHEHWIYYDSAGPDFEGFQGFIRSNEEIDRIARVLSKE